MCLVHTDFSGNPVEISLEAQRGSNYIISIHKGIQCSYTVRIDDKKTVHLTAHGPPVFRALQVISWVR